MSQERAGWAVVWLGEGAALEGERAMQRSGEAASGPHPALQPGFWSMNGEAGPLGSPGFPVSEWSPCLSCEELGSTV